MTPYQPSFNAYNTANPGTATSITDLVFNGTRHNVGSHYSTSTGRFTAPVDGSYFFSAMCNFSSSTSNKYWRIKVNGTHREIIYADNSVSQSRSIKYP